MRANLGSFLSDDQIRRVAPSVFATQPWEKMSDKYLFIPTIDVLHSLANEGFMPVSAEQSRTRIEGKAEFTKHALRLRHVDDLAPRVVGDVFPEVLLVNSHDGASTYQISAGLWRLACSNGMCAPESVQRITVRHTGNLGDEVIDNCIRVLDDAKDFRGKMLSWQGIQMTPPEQSLLASTALALRWDASPTGRSSAPIDPGQLLRVRRWDDQGNNLFVVTNRIQEALTKGGDRGFNATGKRTTTRAVTGVAENLRLNRAIMTLAEKFAELKAGN